MSYGITWEQCEEARIGLIESDDEYARLKAMATFEEHKRKVIRSQITIAAMVADTKLSHAKALDHALVSNKYRDHLVKLQEADQEFETFKAKRLSYSMTIELFRSTHRAQKEGNI